MDQEEKKAPKTEPSTQTIFRTAQEACSPRPADLKWIQQWAVLDVHLLGKLREEKDRPIR